MRSMPRHFTPSLYVFVAVVMQSIFISLLQAAASLYLHPPPSPHLPAPFHTPPPPPGSYICRLQRQVYSHLSVANLGGTPGTLPLVQSYLAVRPPTAAPEEPLVRGLPVWAVIYHCLRCGDPQAAREAAAQAGLVGVWEG